MCKERLYELDILRALGTFIIVFHHLPDYTGNFYDLSYFGIPINLSGINVLNRYFGLGIFVFVSGFVLYYTNPRVDNISSFLKKRCVRLFPLYLVALALFSLTYRRLGLFETFIHIPGLQILMAPRFVDPMPTLWFIGLIVMLYLFHVFLVRRTRSDLGLILFSLAVFGLLGFIRCVFHIVEYRFFLYFFIFLLGVICCRVKLFSRYDLGISHISIATLVLFASILVFASFRKGEVTEAFISRASTVGILVVSIALNTMMLAFIFIAFTLAKKVKRCLNKTAIRFLSFASFSSYGVYLFHRPILYVITKALSLLFSYESYWMPFFLVGFGLPLIFFLSYIAQISSNKIIERLRSWHKEFSAA